MRRFLAALLAAVFWAPIASAAPAPSYPFTPPPYNSSAQALGSINGQVVNFPLWGIAQTIIYGNPTIGHCSVWVSGPNGLQLGDGSCSGGGGVSSVGLSLPGQFNCTGTPVTGSGTIDCTWGSANANTIFAGPSSGSASTPTFRAMVAADLPATGVGAGSCNYCDLTFGADGRIYAAASGSVGSVTTTGSPASGELAKFSGSTSITNGDLTGDVTTSGSLATTLAASGATAGTYSNSTITVDAKGRVTYAATGSVEVPYTGAQCASTPSLGTFVSTANLGSLTLSTGVNALQIAGTPSSSGGATGVVSLWYYAAPTAPYSIYMRSVASMASGGGDTNGGPGIALYNSSTGKVVTLVRANDGRVLGQFWNSPTSYNGAWINGSTVDNTPWLRFDVTSTTFTMYYSVNGYNWDVLYGPHNISDWPGAIDSIGIVANNNYQLGSAFVQCFTGTAPS